MKKFIFKSIYLVALFAFVLTSCNNDDDNNQPAPVNEEEEITTLTITFSEAGSTTPVAFYTFRDLDGDGGNDPTISSSGDLDANTDYTATIVLLNENEDMTSAEYDVTAEIRAEDDEHQFFFDYGNLFSSFAYGDTDGTNPIGLTTNWTAGEVGSGTLKITLRHQPDKEAAGVSDGDIANAGGDTDIEVSFDINVQ